MVQVARRRGELMRDAAATPGSMIAVVATIEKVRELLPKDSPVVVANHNAPEQIVWEDRCCQRGRQDPQRRRAQSSATHSCHRIPLRSGRGLCEAFCDFSQRCEGQKPTLPVYGCSKAEPYPAQAKSIRTLLANQIAKPVRFVEQVQAMYDAGIRTFIEVGPGNVLTNLTGRILSGKEHRAIQLDRKGKDGVTSFQHGLAQLVAGVQMDLNALWTAYAEQVDPRTVQKAPLELRINGANYGKPYSPEGGLPSSPLPIQKSSQKSSFKKSSKKSSRRFVEAPVYQQAPAQAVEQPQAVQSHPTTAPAVIAQAPIQPALPADAYGAWLGAFQQVQQQTLEAHAAWQRTMSDTHLAFLQSAEATMHGLTALAGGPTLKQHLPSPRSPWFSQRLSLPTCSQRP